MNNYTSYDKTQQYVSNAKHLALIVLMSCPKQGSRHLYMHGAMHKISEHGTLQKQNFNRVSSKHL